MCRFGIILFGFGLAWLHMGWFGMMQENFIWYGPATIVGLGRGGEEERAMMVAAALQSGPAPPSATTASCGGTVRLIFLAHLFVFVLLLFFVFVVVENTLFCLHSIPVCDLCPEKYGPNATF